MLSDISEGLGILFRYLAGSEYTLFPAVGRHYKMMCLS
ncbi:MAG: hypothetical protein JSC188_000257 [Candidatus Tokpelaia sp. JSC188]|nr:MAG: hypothetical protein JSC188_000257 [Candidatus Tokpelaia sp. JSC188]